jgi:hypothetical protein
MDTRLTQRYTVSRPVGYLLLERVLALEQAAIQVYSIDGHVLGWWMASLRLRRFIDRQTVPGGSTAARAAALHHVHG